MLRSCLAALVAALIFAAPASATAPVLTYTPTGPNSITLEWNACCSASEYRVESSLSGYSLTKETSMPKSITEGSEAEVSYRVQKYKPTQGEWSNTVTVKYPIGATSAPAGEVKYRLDAKSYCDATCGGDKGSWLVEHIDRVLGYGSFGQTHYAPYVQSLDYLDAYTKWGSLGLTAEHIATYEKECKEQVEKGYAGIFSDDIEFTSGYHQAGTPTQVGELIEACRKGAGSAAVIEINTQYSDLHTRLANSDVGKALSATNQVDVENGLSTSSSFDTKKEFEEYLTYVDALHAKGIHVDQADSTAGNVYEVSAYLIANDGGDFIGSHETPAEWNALYDTNLGAATGPRELIGSVYRRKFIGGTVYVDPPGGTTQTIDGHTLKAREGLIA